MSKNFKATQININSHKNTMNKIKIIFSYFQKNIYKTQFRLKNSTNKLIKIRPIIHRIKIQLIFRKITKNNYCRAMNNMIL